MRSLLALVLLATPAAAWEFTPGPVCLLTHDAPGAALRLTYDPRGPEYAITVTRKDGPWSPAPIFSMRFDGPRGLTISTERHVPGDEGRALTVTDRGFGNVLDGLEFNDTATALTQSQSVTVDLSGAAPEVRRFRDCAAAPTA